MHHRFAIRSLGIVSLLLLAACGDSGSTTTNTTVVSPVAVSAVFPAEARAGETITVSGQQFGATQGTSTLRINGVTATQIVSWSDTQIEATVPAGATTGNVTVTVDGVAGAPGHLVVLWQATNPANVAVSAAPLDQINPQLTSDGAGGAIVVWQDHRVLTDANNGGGDIYAQRVNNAGVPQWAADGVAISTTARGKVRPQIASDGMGGAIIVWTDNALNQGYGDIYAQRVNSAGVPQWGVGGVSLGTAFGVGAVAPHIVADGAGGAIVVWNGLSTSIQLRVQRVNSAGVPQWTSAGLALTAGSSNEYLNNRLLADGAGGVFVVWSNFGTNGLRAQHVSGTGVEQWTAGGVNFVVAGTAASNPSRPKLTTDGAGGVIVAWNYSNSVFAQRVSNTGAPQWGAVTVATSTNVINGSIQVQIVSDDAGGAIIGWADASEISVQRLNGAGVTQWAAAGVALGTMEPVGYDTSLPETPLFQLIPDNSGGATVVWEDFRGGVTDLYAQRVNDAGVPQWANATTVCTAADRQARPQLAADGVGGAVVVWQDRRNGSDYDIYAQGITASGRQ